MTTADITGFRDFVLEQNTYLVKGYAPAYAENGKVYVNNPEREEVAINGDDGNYFYIRVDGDMTFPVERGSKATDCGAGRVGFLDTMPVVMVVVMQNADPYTLLNNMRNTALSYSGMAILPTGAQLVREMVVAEETGDYFEDVMRNMGNQTIIKIKLTLAKSYRANTCIIDPCSCI